MERVGLYRSQNFEDSWEAILHPWFREQSLSREVSAGTAAVIVPHVSCIAFLKTRLLEQGKDDVSMPHGRRALLRQSLFGH